MSQSGYIKQLLEEVLTNLEYLNVETIENAIDEMKDYLELEV